MKVWILERGFWEDTYNLGVFSTKEKAEDAMRANKYFNKHKFYVYELTLDEVLGD